ncbi:hypothetical protein MIND_00125900 [Mycena indigotica]|uniref:F-box domain-containing protein n=1 Tax=Mycena indigotica TaxID=2126181 RepID=A0A8H6WEU7_9AGAR|nr:uncharacterized protein MIND_00125900 [Mycena indigotica]KAF7316079.1 hypothetical protein MIND_00125900 [Mycena indigotica]
MSLPLPPELVDKIASLVPDKETLRSLSLVCTGCIYASQRALFKTLVVVYAGVGADGVSISCVENIFSQSPRLASYVQDLTMVLSGNKEHVDHQASISLLGRVHRLQHLVVSGSSSIPSRENMQNLPDHVVSALIAAFARPSLQRLALRYLCEPPPALLLAAMGVPVVSFELIWLLSGLPLPQSDQPSPKPRLRELATMQSTLLDSIFEFLVSPQGLVYATEIKTLEFQVSTERPRYIDQLMLVCGSNLERFSITFSVGTVPILLPKATSTTLPLLRALELRVYLDENGSFPENFNSNLANLACASLALETITIKCNVCAPQTMWMDPYSSAVEESFPRHSAAILPKLRRLDCMLVVNRSAFNEWDAEDVYARFTKFMGLRMSGFSTEAKAGTPLLAFDLIEVW